LIDKTATTYCGFGSRFLSSEADHGRLIVHGHTQVRSGMPGIHPNRITLDTGAVFGCALTAAAFLQGKIGAAEYLQV